MPRPARVVIPGLPHHVTHRANRRAEIFRQADDYEIYLRLLQKHADQNDLRLDGYTVMPNHIHLVATPARDESLSDAIQEAHGTYATIFNAKYGVTGHTWEGRYFSCVLDPSHFWNALRYVERNPVRARIVTKAEQYRWSSAAGHCGLRHDRLLAGEKRPEPVIQNWSAWLNGENPDGIDDYIRNQTFAGHPCGREEYFRDLEARLNRPVLPKRRGRPRKMGK